MSVAPEEHEREYALPFDTSMRTFILALRSSQAKTTIISREKRLQRIVVEIVLAKVWVK